LNEEGKANTAISPIPAEIVSANTRASIELTEDQHFQQLSITFG